MSTAGAESYDAGYPFATIDVSGPRLKLSVLDEHSALLERYWYEGGEDYDAMASRYLEEHIETCKGCLDDYSEHLQKKRLLPIVQGSSAESSQEKSLRLERDTWILLKFEGVWSSKIQGHPHHRFSLPGPGASGGSGFDGPYWYDFFSQFFRQQRMRKDRRESLRKAVNELLFLETLIAWLQEVEKLQTTHKGSGTVGVDKCELDLIHTRRSLANGDKTVVQELDPDAPLREGARLHVDDVKERMYQLNAVWKELRMGNFATAQDKCRSFGQHFQAAMLQGAHVWKSSSGAASGRGKSGAGNEGERQRICERVVERRAWKKTCRELAERLAHACEGYGEGAEGGAEPDGDMEIEARLFGVLGGLAKYGKDASRGWADWCWIHLKELSGDLCDYLLSVTQELLSEAIVPPGSEVVGNNHLQSSSFDSLESMFDGIQFATSDVTKRDRENPYRVLQELVMRKANNEVLIAKLKEYVLAVVYERSSQANVVIEVLDSLGPTLPQLPSANRKSAAEFRSRKLDPESFLRFAAHLYLFKKIDFTLDQNEEQRRDYLCDSGKLILLAYCGHLIQVRRYGLLPRYLRYLSQEVQRRVYRIFLRSLDPKDTKTAFACLKDLSQYFDPRVVEQIKKDHVSSIFSSLDIKDAKKEANLFQAGHRAIDRKKIEALRCYGSEDRLALIDDVTGLFREFVKCGRHGSAVELRKFLEDEGLKAVLDAKTKEAVAGEEWAKKYKEFEDWLDYVKLLDWHRHCRQLLRDMPGHVDAQAASRLDPLRREQEEKEIKKKEQKWIDETDRDFTAYYQEVKELVTKATWLEGLADVRSVAVVNVVYQILEVSENLAPFKRRRDAQMMIDLIADEEYRIYDCFRKNDELKALMRKISDIYISNLDFDDA